MFFLEADFYIYILLYIYFYIYILLLYSIIKDNGDKIK